MIRVVLDLNCPLAPQLPIGALGWLDVTPQYNIVWFDQLSHGLYSRRVSMGDQQIKNYVKVIGAPNEQKES